MFVLNFKIFVFIFPAISIYACNVSLKSLFHRRLKKVYD